MLRRYTFTFDAEQVTLRHAALSLADAIPGALQGLEKPSRMLD